MAERADICIVGGGIIGCSLAFELSQAGRKVVLVERDQVASQASGEAAGMLTPLAEAQGPGAFLELALASLELFPQVEGQLRELTGIDIELLRWGILHLACDEKELEEMEKRHLWLKEAGLGAERLTQKELRDLEPALAEDILGALFFPRDWHVQNRRMTQAYALAAQSLGATIHTQRPATGLLVEANRVMGISTPSGPIHAEVTVNCAGPWASCLAATAGLGLAMEPVKGQLVGLEFWPPPVRHVIYSSRAYLVPRLGGEVVLGTTEERVGFNTEPTVSGVAGILQGALSLCPALAKAPLRRAWAGLRPTPPDELPYIGWDHRLEGLAHATGHHRNGILLAPITARLMRELLCDEPLSLDLRPFAVDRQGR
jgi:glycine oxidase